MKVLIVGSGSLSDSRLLADRCKWADLVIAADGGALHLAKSGLVPHILLGDFDSIPASVLEKLTGRKDVEVIRHPVRKDYTDMELAVDLAADRGATELVMLGACGSRLDHTAGNIFLLHKLLDKGIEGHIEDDKNQVYMIKDSLKINKQGNRKVSLLPLTSSVEGITTKGLSYALRDDTLFFGINRGISNEFEEETAVITLKKGVLLVFISED